MTQEKSAGIIVYRHRPNLGRQYLVIYHRGDYWNFPKGGVEAGDSEMETAIRELEEETGLTRIKIVDGWRQQTQFFFNVNRDGVKDLIRKDVVFYLAETSMAEEARPSDKQSKHEVINGYAWLDFKMATKYLKFKNLQEILAEAESYLTAEAKKNERG
ncbi:MAG: NUDIX domain-containing protein [Patescibacteria group bacterium]